MHPHFVTRHATIMALVCAAFAAGTAAQGADDVTRWVPKDTLVFIGVNNIDQSVEAFKKTSEWQMTQDPALQEAVKPFKEFLKEFRKQLATRLDIDRPELLEIQPHGGLALFLTAEPPPPGADEPVTHIGAVMDMGEDAAKARQLFDMILQKSLDKGGRKEVNEIAGMEITTIFFKQKEPGTAEEPTDPMEEMPEISGDPFTRLMMGEPPAEVVKDFFEKAEMPEKLAFAFKDSMVILAEDKSTAERAAKVLKDPDQSFAGSPTVQSLRRRCPKEAHFFLAVDLAGLFETAAKADPDADKWLKSMGVGALGPFVAAQIFAPDAKVNARFTGFLEVKPERKGLARILMMKNSATAPPPPIGADTAMFFSANINLATIVEEVIAITERTDPEQAAMMRSQMQAPLPDGTMLDLQKDVFNHVVGPLFALVSLSKPYDTDHVGTLFAIGHDSRASLEKALGLIPPGFLNKRDMMGSNVYESAMLPIPGLAAALTDRTLVLAGTTNAIEGYIRGENRASGGLAEDEGFKNVARHMPKQSCVMFYVDGKKVHDAQVAIKQAGDVSIENPPMFGMPASAFVRWWLYQQGLVAKVENPEQLTKYQHQEIGTISSENEGLSFEAVSVPVQPIAAPKP